MAEPELDEAARPARSPQRRRFGPVVLIGLLSAGLLALTGTRDWARLASAGDQQVASIASASTVDGAATAPLVTAVALALLATWGVLLVTRGRFRQLLTLLGLVAAAGAAAVGVTALVRAPASLRETFESFGVTEVAVERTVWPYLALVALALAAAAAVTAVLDVRGWPEMGSRYDAPQAGAAPAERPAEEQSSLELWKAMDEGHDPTR